jgi:DNA-binding LytR/AlgR family response regulator
MLKFFIQPYPFYHQSKSLWRTTLLIFVIGFLFEYFLIPFQRTPEEHKFSYAIISLFHVGVAAIIYNIFFLVIGQFINEDDWQVFKEIIAVAILLLLIGIGEWAIRDLIYDNPHNREFEILLEEVWHAYLSGSVIFALVLSINVNWLTSKHQQQAKTLDVPHQSQKMKVMIKAQINSDNFELSTDQLICAKAEGNYVEFYCWQIEHIHKQVKRISLSSLNEQLVDVPYLVKTHRTYLVNLNYLKKITGNAQGYQLTLQHLDFQVPVSRSHLQKFNKQMSRS